MDEPGGFADPEKRERKVFTERTCVESSSSSPGRRSGTDCSLFERNYCDDVMCDVPLRSSHRKRGDVAARGDAISRRRLEGSGQTFLFSVFRTP